MSRSDSSEPSSVQKQKKFTKKKPIYSDDSDSDIENET